MTNSDPRFSAGIVEAVTDELLAHGEFSSGANNRSNAREAARVVVDMVRTFNAAQSAGMREQRRAERKERTGLDVEEALTLDDLPQCSAANEDALEALRVLLEESDISDLHGGDHHEDGCPTCEAIKTLERALTSTVPQTLPVGPRELKPITMSDIRLMAGEGTLTPKDVLAAANAVLRMRQSSLLPRPEHSGDGK